MTPPPASPLRGRYLVRHRLLNAVLRGVDGVLSLRGRRGSPPVPVPGAVLVANIAHLGDALLSTGVLAALRSAFPGVRIGFLAGSWARGILEGHPLVDRLHTFDHARLNRVGAEWVGKVCRHIVTRSRAIRAIRAEGYDVAIDLYPYFPNAIPLLWAAGVPVRIGYTSAGFGPLLSHPVDWPLADWHVTRYHARLLEELPLPAPPAMPLAPVLPDDGTPLPAGLPGSYVVVHPGAGAAFKEWPIDRWQAVVRALQLRGHAVVFTGNGDREQAVCSALAAGQTGCLDLCGRLSWRAFVAVVRAARLLVGVDSVAAHVAGAVGTACVVLATGITHPAHWAPLGPRICVLRHRVDCSPCYRSHGCAGMDCLRGLEPAEVLRAAEGLLAGRTDTQAA